MFFFPIHSIYMFILFFINSWQLYKHSSFTQSQVLLSSKRVKGIKKLNLWQKLLSKHSLFEPLQTHKNLFVC